MSKTFRSFREASAYFARAALIQERVGQAALEKAGRDVLAHAKSKFGSYQPQTGEWARWMWLAESTKAERVNKGYPEDEPLLREGTLKNSITLSTKHGRIVIGSQDPRMIFHEFGTVNMPPRAVLGPALYEKRNQVAKVISRAIVNHAMYGFVKVEDI